MPARLTTSSFAILGLLAIRSWTGYELTQQATRSLRFAWPKSERLLYAEPKKLVEHGLATAAQESTGGRSRTIYTITEEGRAALTSWLATTPEPPLLEAESLLRLLFAEHGTIADLTSALDAMAADALQRREQIREINVSYLDGLHPFPERTHLSALFATFQLEFCDLTIRWVEFAKTEIAAWPATGEVGMNAGTRVVLEDIKHHRSTLDRHRDERAALAVVGLAGAD